MPVRQLDLFLQTAYPQLLYTQPLQPQTLHTRIAICAQTFVRRLLNQHKFILAMHWNASGDSFVRNLLTAELQMFKSANIHAFFVLSGLGHCRPERPFSTLDRRPNAREQGWNQLQANSINAAKSSFALAGLPSVVDLMSLLVEILELLNIEYIRAPYASLPQLAYVDKSARGYFHIVYAGTDYLLYNIDRVITSLDFENQQYTTVDKRRLMNALQLSPEQFVDVCLLAGCDYLATLPPLLDTNVTPGGFSFQTALEMIRVYGSGYAAVQSFAEHPQVLSSNYLDAYARAHALIRHHPVFTDQCTLEPLHPTQAPNDLHLIFGPRLPQSLALLLTHGLVSTNGPLGAYTTGRWVDSIPLCNSTAETMRPVFDTKITKERGLMLGVLRDICSGGNEAREAVLWTPWYASSEDIPFVYEPANKTEWPYAFALNPLDLSGEGEGSKNTGLWQSLMSFAAGKDAPKRAAHQLTTMNSVHDFQFGVHVLLLQTVGLLDLKKRKLTPEGEHLFQYMKQWLKKNQPTSGEINPGLVEELMEVLLEVSYLKRCGFFNRITSATELLAHLACFFSSADLSLSSKDGKDVKDWLFGYDRNLLSTHTAQKTVMQHYRQLLEIGTAYLCCTKSPVASEATPESGVLDKVVEWLQPDITKRIAIGQSPEKQTAGAGFRNQRRHQLRQQLSDYALGLGHHFHRETSTLPGIIFNRLQSKQKKVGDIKEVCITDEQGWWKSLLSGLECVSGAWKEGVWLKAHEHVSQM